MIIDCHTHIFPKEIRQNREYFFSSEPAFKMLYDSPKATLLSANDLVDAMDENGVDRSVVFGFPWKRSAHFKLHNDYVMKSVVRHPRRLIGLGCFHPGHKGAYAEAVRCFEGNLAGIGELAFYESGMDESALKQLDPVMALCRGLGAPVLIHTNEPVGHDYPGKAPHTLSQIYTLIKRFSQNRIILAHWGGGIFFFNLLKKEVKESLKNVYFDTAASPFLYDFQIYSLAAKIIGPERILFGSDYPLINPTRYFKEMKASGLSPKQAALICGDNAHKLFSASPA